MKDTTEAGMTSLLMKQLAKQPETYPCAFLYGSDDRAEQCAEQFLRCLSICRPNASTCLTDAEALWRDIFSNLRSGNVPSVPEQCQDCDVLIMFNVEKLGGMYATQELFYGLFDELTEHGKQVLLFSACAPHEIEKLERRNLTQFEGCLVWSMNSFNCKAATTERGAI